MAANLLTHAARVTLVADLSAATRVLLALSLVACTSEQPGTDDGGTDAAIVDGLMPVDSASAADASTAADAGGDAGTADDCTPPTGDVYLSAGDDLQAASDANPAGTVFVLGAGIYTGQRVVNPKSGTLWVGAPGAVLDGEDTLTDAFHGSATDVEVRCLEIRAYVDNGIWFNGGSGVTIDRIAVYDTGSGSGEQNGAVRLDNMSDLTVTRSHFERVSSGVLPTSCTGPIVIEHNTGLNIGRNFVQLAVATGGGIRVRYNTMDRDGTYLRPDNDDVEDWISVWNVQGLGDDYVQISFNRARGHGPSASGSFIMLGDGGGQYQEAVGNYGVTPGQVGIGLSGGHYIEARDNFMYSAMWADSNIAFYSADYGTGGCGDHVVSGNHAHWINRDAIENDFWASGTCSPVLETDNVFPDTSLDETLWDAWPY